MATMVAGRSCCLSGNRNIRAVTLHGKNASHGPVEVGPLRERPRSAARRTYSDMQPNFFLFGDAAASATADVIGNPQAAKPLVLVRGTDGAAHDPRTGLAAGFS